MDKAEDDAKNEPKIEPKEVWIYIIIICIRKRKKQFLTEIANINGGNFFYYVFFFSFYII